MKSTLLPHLKAWARDISDAGKRRAYRSNAITSRGSERHSSAHQQSNAIKIEHGTLQRGGISSLLYSAGFHADGRPRGWLRSLLLKDKTRGTPRLFARKLLLAKSGSIRPLFADWYKYYEEAPQNATMANYSRFLESCQSAGHLAVAQTLHIVGTAHVQFVMEAIQSALSGTRLTVTTSTEMPQTFTHDLYIVLTPHRFNRLPPAERLIQMQMEQVRASDWVTLSYINRLRDSIAILDYAIDNISPLIDAGVPWKQIYFVPIRPMPLSAGTEKSRDIRDIDVLFYGDVSAPRRQRFLDALKKKFAVTVVSDTFGDELATLIKRSKVVCNIHFYDNAILETTRLSESLSWGARVVSEQASDQANHGYFERLLDFVPVDDIDLFLKAIESNLNDWREPQSPLDDQDISGMRYHVLRALNGIGVLSFEELRDATKDFKLPSNRMVLALPEHCQRYEHAETQCLPGAILFHGLRHPQAWKGCANSYRLIASLARMGPPNDRLLIYEDDALFDADIQSRLSAVEHYLDKHPGEWDLFSGLMTDVPADAKVKAIAEFQGERFFHLNSMTGMVFSILSQRGLALIADFEFHGDDIRRHTIDRFLESRAPCCITTKRPLVQHAENLDSSLWPASNVAYAKKIQTSQRRLEYAVSSFSNRECGDRGSM